MQAKCHELSARDKPRPNEAMSNFLRRTGRFHELLLFAWGEVEFNTDQIVLHAFELHGDPNHRKIKFLLDKSFDRKLSFLRDIGVIKKEKFDVIHKFQEKRNIFFHDEGWTTAFMMSEEEKKQVIDEAVKASTLTLNVLFRTIRPR